jgi:transglutaminase-like putative cysteine protease
MNENTRQYRLEHCTFYHYTEPVLLSHQQLHLTPRPLSTQQVHHHEVTIQPRPTVRHDITDAFGNPLTEIAMESAHRTLDIIAKSSITVGAPDSLQSAKDIPWEQIRDLLRYRAGWRPEPDTLEASRFLFESPHARVKRSLRAYASVCFTDGRSIIEATTALMAKIHSEFKYDAKATTVATPVMQFFAQKRGVCQDFAHLMISCLRSTGLAARYVSGYLLTRSAPDKPRRVGADASHAWVSLYVPEHGWVDFDPTNNLMPSTEHITLGWGRDFSDVTPLRGVINGGGEQKLDVKVTVEPV